MHMEHMVYLEVNFADVNECSASNTHPCVDNDHCANTVSYFNIEVPTFIHVIFADVNECSASNTHPCVDNDHCTNTISYFDI